MALVNISSARTHALRILETVDSPGGVELLSYKRDRRVIILKKDDSQYTIHEQGYTNQVIDVSIKRLGRILKTLIKREFPRSHKIRFARFNHPDQLSNIRR